MVKIPFWTKEDHSRYARTKKANTRRAKSDDSCRLQTTKSYRRNGDRANMREQCDFYISTNRPYEGLFINCLKRKGHKGKHLLKSRLFEVREPF